MALSKIDAKIRIKRSSIVSAVPTIGPSADHTDGTWSVNDIYVGEFYENITDDRLWIGTSSGIQEITLSPVGAPSGIPLDFVSGSTNRIAPSFGTHVNSSNSSSILGGNLHTISASGGYNNIVGGVSNYITGTSARSSIGGGQYVKITSSSRSFIGGGYTNEILGGSNYSFIGGGEGNTINSAGNHIFVGGGYSNTITSSGANNIIIGGKTNAISITAKTSTIVGGLTNLIKDSDYSFIGGGASNEMSQGILIKDTQSSVIAGGYANKIGGTNNGTIVGGRENRVNFGTGGLGLSYSGDGGTVVGGRGNQVMDNYSFVGGGRNNTQYAGDYSVISGGYNNYGGYNYSVIGGGKSNGCNGAYSSILGGQSNTSGYFANTHIIGSNITATRADTTFTEDLKADGVVQVKVYTVATVPTVGTYPGGMIMVSDETGGYVPAFSDGTNWRRVTDRAIVA